MMNSGKITLLGVCIPVLSFCAACGASAPSALVPVASPTGALQMQRELATAAPSSLVPSAVVPLQVSPVPTVGTSASAGQAAAGQGKPMVIQQVFDIPDGILDVLDTLLEECVGAFFEASIQNGGQPTTTGTLRRLADGTFTYSATESGDLLLTDRSGDIIRMTFSEVEGDLNADARQLLRGDHRVGCTIDVPNTLTVELSAIKGRSERDVLDPGHDPARRCRVQSRLTVRWHTHLGSRCAGPTCRPAAPGKRGVRRCHHHGGRGFRLQIGEHRAANSASNRLVLE